MMQEPSVTSEPDRDDPTSHEVDRHVDDQPERDDVLDPDDIVATDGPLDEGAGAVDDPDPFHRDDEPPRAGTDPAELPESQGADADVAERLAEDDGVREPLHDEI